MHLFTYMKRKKNIVPGPANFFIQPSPFTFPLNATQRALFVPANHKISFVSGILVQSVDTNSAHILLHSLNF